jgi:flagellar protein FlbB
MAGKSGVIGRAVLLILLIAALLAGCLVWFDYLGLIDVKDTLRPVYKVLGLQTRSPKRINPNAEDLLEEERSKKQEDSILVRNQELDAKQDDLKKQENEIAQKSQQLDERQKALDDQEKSFNDKQKEVETKSVNVNKNAERLQGMPPENAVKILEAMDDEDVIDILRAVDAQALKAGSDSIVPYWMSKMDPARAAVIQRKMTEKPEGQGF